jgi:hypothetical protein
MNDLDNKNLLTNKETSITEEKLESVIQFEEHQNWKENYNLLPHIGKWI